MRILYYIFAILFGLSFWYMPTHDPDLGWHLLGGSWILSHGAVPREDIVNTFASTWIDYHWFAQLILFKIYSWGGYDALRLALGLFMALFAVVILRLVDQALGSNARPTAIIVSFLVIMFLVEVNTSIRPSVIVLFLLAVSVIILNAKDLRRFELPLLFTMAVLAANMHVYWVFIPALWLLYRVLSRLRRETLSPLYAWGGLVALSSAGLLSPYGIFSTDATPGAIWANYLVIYDYLLMPSALRDLISEFKPSLGADGVLPILLLVITAVFAITTTWKRVLAKGGSFTALLISYVLALRGLKFVALLGVLGAPSLAKSLSSFLRKFAPWSMKQELLLSRIFLFGAIGYLSIYVLNHRPWYYDNSFYMDEFLPVQACERIEDLVPVSREGRSHVRVLTHFDHGGWCRWIAYSKNSDYQMRVTTDGRTQLVPLESYLASFDLYRLRNNWTVTLSNWDPDVVLAEKNTPLAQLLVRDSNHWKLAHEDRYFALFLPK